VADTGVALAKVVVPLATTVYVDVPETTTVLLAGVDVALEPEAAEVVVAALALLELFTLVEDCEWLRDVEEPHELPDDVEDVELLAGAVEVELTTLALLLEEALALLDEEEEPLEPPEQLELARTEN